LQALALIAYSLSAVLEIGLLAAGFSTLRTITHGP
jgi:hypothetical protein